MKSSNALRTKALVSVIAVGLVRLVTAADAPSRLSGAFARRSFRNVSTPDTNLHRFHRNSLATKRKSPSVTALIGGLRGRA